MQHWVEQFAKGDDQIDVEIQAALLDKSDDFNPSKHVPSLKRILDEHVFANAPLRMNDTLAREQLAVDEMAFLMKQLL